MYENYWNLREKPFRNVTDKKYFFYAESYEETYLRLLYSVTESQGLFLLMGESGCGKSFLSKVFMQDMLEQGYKVALISNPTFAPDEFLQQVLYEYGMEFSGKSRLELLHDLKQMAENVPSGKGCVLFIDEAHTLQGTKIIQDINVLLNFESNNRFLIVPVLIGKSNLAEVVGKTSLGERVSLQYKVAPLTCRETAEYIYHRMNKAGSGREIFTAEAVKSIHTATLGVPREINRICDLALLLGFGDNAIVVDNTLIQKTLEEIKGESTKAALADKR